MSEKAIASGSLVLVTGVNGYIASHVADQLMSLGYRVRGTARENGKLESIGQALRKRNPSALFEGFVLSDLTATGAFDEAVKGCAGIIHLATDVSFDPDPKNVITPVVEMTRNLLEVAARTPTVRRLVYTSSSIAAVHPTPNEQLSVDSSSWNETDLRDAWAPPPYDPSRSFAVYGASKVQAEQAAWEFVKAEPRSFVLNTVLPNFAVGPRFDVTQPGSTSGWVRGLYEGDAGSSEQMRTFPPQWSVDVRDVARLHVAPLLELDVQNERIFAFAEPFNYSRVVSILKELDPSRQQYPPPLADEGQDIMTIANSRAVELLKRAGRSGFIELKESLREQLEAESALKQ